jgi:cell wall-associated NlpC family hydrolase
MQSAFAASGIWLPRDSYQQEAFCQKIEREELLAGDLIFFGDKKVNHVALYLGDNQYIHSSGKETGNNGIAINLLSADIDSVSHHYYQKLWSFGRVMHN